jgi:hypothetical protein
MTGRSIMKATIRQNNSEQPPYIYGSFSFVSVKGIYHKRDPSETWSVHTSRSGVAGCGRRVPGPGRDSAPTEVCQEGLYNFIFLCVPGRSRRVCQGHRVLYYRLQLVLPGLNSLLQAPGFIARSAFFTTSSSLYCQV